MNNPPNHNLNKMSLMLVCLEVYASLFKLLSDRLIFLASLWTSVMGIF